jgi:SLOG cluster3 family
MIYSLSLPRKTERYRQRPLMHLLQLFGRTPTRKDIQDFAGCAKDAGFEPHPQHGPHYDSAILRAAMPTRIDAHLDTSGVHTDSISDYVAEIQRGIATPTDRAKRLVISGAFPDCEPEFQQNLTNAVHAMVEASLRAGIGISFGAHPTFQFMIFDVAKRLRPSDHLSAVRMYISRFFVTDPTINELRKDAEVRPIDANGDRASSLTRMREAMMRDPDAGALVVIGGKKARPEIPPGVDEEIALAREAGLPVYVIGSVGGRSSELISGMNLKDRSALNGLPEAKQDLFATSLDYAALAQLILTTTF